MNKLLTFSLLALAAAPAMALPVKEVPTAEMLPMLGAGLLVFLVARRRK